MQCPICGSKLVTEDMYLYTCINCDTLFTIEELEEAYDDSEKDDGTVKRGESE